MLESSSGLGTILYVREWAVPEMHASHGQVGKQYCISERSIEKRRCPVLESLENNVVYQRGFIGRLSE